MPQAPKLMALKPSSKKVPTSCEVVESTVIDAPICKVFEKVKSLDRFSAFWTELSRCRTIKGDNPEDDTFEWVFHDGTELLVKREEFSVSCLTTPSHPLR
jgi:hypothetical protein